MIELQGKRWPKLSWAEEEQRWDQTGRPKCDEHSDGSFGLGPSPPIGSEILMTSGPLVLANGRPVVVWLEAADGETSRQGAWLVPTCLKKVGAERPGPN